MLVQGRPGAADERRTVRDGLALDPARQAPERRDDRESGPGLLFDNPLGPQEGAEAGSDGGDLDALGAARRFLRAERSAPDRSGVGEPGGERARGVVAGGEVERIGGDEASGAFGAEVLAPEVAPGAEREHGSGALVGDQGHVRPLACRGRPMKGRRGAFACRWSSVPGERALIGFGGVLRSRPAAWPVVRDTVPDQPPHGKSFFREIFGFCVIGNRAAALGPARAMLRKARPYHDLHNDTQPSRERVTTLRISSTVISA